MQVKGRTQNRLISETLELAPYRGFCMLPAPSPGDIFFDIEGDPFVGEGGLDYLFGHIATDADGAHRHTVIWAFSRADEKASFERFVDTVTTRWAEYPDMHIYHFGGYAPGAMKRLMGRYATREEAVDRMLRAGLFVDLSRVMREGIRASVGELFAEIYGAVLQFQAQRAVQGGIPVQLQHPVGAGVRRCT